MKNLIISVSLYWNTRFRCLLCHRCQKIKLTTFLLLALQMELAMSFLKMLQIETNGDIAIDRSWHLESAIDVVFRYSALRKYRVLPASRCVQEHFYHVEVSYYGEASCIKALATFCNMSGVRQKLEYLSRAQSDWAQTWWRPWVGIPD